MDSQTTTDERAGFWLRAGAYMIDGFIASLIGMLGILLLASVGLATTARFAPAVAAAAYFTVLPVVMAGQTPGKRLAGLEIVRRDGEPITYATGFVRWLGYMLSVLTLCLGFLMALFTAEGRALEDYLAGTRVVRRQELPLWRKIVVVGAGVTLPLACLIGIAAAIAIPNVEQGQKEAADASAPAPAATATAPAVSSPSSLPDRSSGR